MNIERSSGGRKHDVRDHVQSLRLRAETDAEATSLARLAELLLAGVRVDEALVRMATIAHNAPNQHPHVRDEAREILGTIGVEP